MKISIISGICVLRDAISSSVRDDALGLIRQSDFSVKVFAYAVEFFDFPSKIVNNINDILLDDHFIESDLIIYHFGVYYELFNLIIIGNGRAKQVVRYHNITEKRWLPEKEWHTIDKSLDQLSNFSWANEIWPVSEVNRNDVLCDKLAAADAVKTIPLCVGDGCRRSSIFEKDFTETNILYLGRFVRSKGILDVLNSIAQIRDQLKSTVIFRLVGSMRFSDLSYVSDIRSTIDVLGLNNMIEFVEDASDDRLDFEFRRSHILVLPSYHEGFCKPVVEAMSYGIVPVTYDSGNLKFVAEQMSVLVQAGDISELGDSILQVVSDLSNCFLRKDTAKLNVEAGSFTLEDYERRVDNVIKTYGFPEVSEMLKIAAQQIVR